MCGFNPIPAETLQSFGARCSQVIGPEDDFTREAMNTPLEALIIGEHNDRSVAFMMTLWKMASKVLDVGKQLESFTKPLENLLSSAKAVVDRDVTKASWTKAELVLVAKNFQKLNRKLGEPEVVKLLQNSELLKSRIRRMAQKVEAEKDGFSASSTIIARRQRDPELSLGTIVNYVDFALDIADEVNHVRQKYDLVHLEFTKSTVVFIEKCFTCDLEVKLTPFGRPGECVTIQCNSSKDTIEKFYIRLPVSATEEFASTIDRILGYCS